MPLIYNLAIIIALLAVFAWFVRHGYLTAKEVLWLGFALVFFATSRTFLLVLRADKIIYGSNVRTLLGMTALMVTPLTVAMIAGIVLLYRSIRVKELAALEIGGLRLRLAVGNIAALRREPPLDALIHPTNTNLRMGSGVGGALKAFGGSVIEKEARAHGPLKVGQAVATGAGRLRVRQIIHAALMGADSQTDPGRIKKALEGALQCARKNRARRIALPVFIAGTAKIPADQITQVTVAAILRARTDFDEVTIVVPNAAMARAFRDELARAAVENAGERRDEI